MTAPIRTLLNFGDRTKIIKHFDVFKPLCKIIFPLNLENSLIRNSDICVSFIK